MQHKDIPNDGLHEPKGTSTASIGQVYVADGVGSGAWTVQPVGGIETAPIGGVYRSNGDGSATWVQTPHGWGYYQHGGGTQVFNVTPSKLLIDGAGANTSEAFLPLAIRGVGSLWDVATSDLTPIAVGDAYTLRIDLPITAETGSVTDIDLQLDIGGAASPSIVIVDRHTTAGKALPYTISIGVPVFSLSTFLANGMQVFVSTDTGTITVTNPTITIVRVSAGDF